MRALRSFIALLSPRLSVTKDDDAEDHLTRGEASSLL